MLAKLLKGAALCCLLVIITGCNNHQPPLNGIYFSQSAHQLFNGYHLSIHSRLRLHQHQFTEIRSYRIKFADTNQRHIDLGVITLEGSLTHQNQQLQVEIEQARVNLDPTLYQRYVSIPQPMFALNDAPSQVRQRHRTLTLLLQTPEGICLSNPGGHSQCYTLSQVL